MPDATDSDSEGQKRTLAALAERYSFISLSGPHGDLGLSDRRDEDVQSYTQKRSLSSQWSSHSWTAGSSESDTLMHGSDVSSAQEVPAESKSSKESSIDTLLDDAADRADSASSHVLPPKYLQHRPFRRRASRRCILWVSYLISLSLIIGYTHIRRSEGALVEDDSDCASKTASATEARFLIDWRAAQNLSYVQAKMIDLTWDTVVGQGGRFLHGWILYHVAARLLTWMMEYSALPYYFHLDVRFSTGSIKSLLSAARFLASRKKTLRSSWSAACLLYATSYTLAFATIWSAVTGYVSPSRSVYTMPDNSFVTATGAGSDSVKLCWSIEDDRLNGTISRVVEGPSFRKVFDGIDFDTETRVDWTRLKLEDVRDETSALDIFRNVYAYALTKRLMQLSVMGVKADFASTLNYTTNASVADRANIKELSIINPITGVYGLYQYPDSVDGGLQQLYGQIDGWRYSGVGEYVANNETAFQEILPHNATYQLDRTITPGPGIVPYNSTLWLGRAPIQLQAPFLRLGTQCSWFDDVLGACACFDGATLGEASFRDGNRSCVSEVGFIWGFASFMLIIGCALEMSWVVVCGLMWYEASSNSDLLQLGRTGTGLTRTLLDVAEPINRELGPDTSAHSEGELTRELARCPPLRYVVEDTDGVTRVKLASVARRSGTRRWDGKVGDDG